MDNQAGSGAFLAQIFEQAPSVMALLRGADLRVELANPSFEGLAGERTVVGLTMADALPLAPVDFIDMLGSVRESGESMTAHAVPITRGATSPDQRIFDFVAQPMREGNGEVTGIFLQGVDVTKQVLAQRAQRDSEALYKGLFDAIDEGFCIIAFLDGPHGPDSDYLHVQANAAYERHAGIPNVVGKRLREIVADDEADAWVARYGAVLRTGEPIRFQQELVATGRFLELASFRIEPPARKQVAVLFHDITARRQAEIALAEINATLGQQVEQRTAELMETEAALRHSQKLEALGQLTGGIAHDFNNLLMAVSSSLYLLRKRLPDDPDTSRLLDNALQGTQRGAALTQRMLAFARRQDLTSELVRLPDLVEGMRELVQRTLGPAWPVETVLPAGLQPVLADANQLEMAILNLAVNARDAMPEGGTIRIEARERAIDTASGDLTPGTYLVLSITDSGTGMDEETLARATEPFFTTKGVGKGTGLGLSMVHGLARQSGGTFTLESRPRQGTTAALWLPAASDDAVEDAPAAPVREAGPVGSLRILAVDDDALVLMNSAALLEDLGHMVVEASSGREALDHVRSGAMIDLVITDHAMPHMTGAQLIEQIEALRPDMPLILATGYGELPAGFRKSVVKLAKPFTQAALAAAIAEAMSGAD